MYDNSGILVYDNSGSSIYPGMILTRQYHYLSVWNAGGTAVGNICLMSERKRSGRQTARWVECSDAIAGSLSALGVLACACLRSASLCAHGFAYAPDSADICFEHADSPHT